jgi:hypothetical protein
VQISPAINYIASSNENSTIYLHQIKKLHKMDDPSDNEIIDRNHYSKLFLNNNDFHELVGGHSKPSKWIFYY